MGYFNSRLIARAAVFGLLALGISGCCNSCPRAGSLPPRVGSPEERVRAQYSEEEAAKLLQKQFNGM